MISPTTIRPATLADLDAILALERIIETAPHWPTATYAAALESRNRCVFLAKTLRTTPELTGFAIALLPPATGLPAELETIAVAPQTRRAGIGRSLLTAVLDWCRDHNASSITLEVRAQSTPAIALYRSLGFLTAGLRPRYYTNPDDDALLLTRSLGAG